MERGTSDFDAWLQTVADAARGLPLTPALDAVSRVAHKSFGARIWFAKIEGRRWSYIAGRASDEPSEFKVSRMPLADDVGLVSDKWGQMPEPARPRLVVFLRGLISAERRSS